MSCLGAFLGLRCTVRARALTGPARARWLALAAVSIGTTGIWVMHFIAMLGYTIPGLPILYNVPITIGSMLLAVIVVFAGLLIVGFGKEGWPTLLLAGTITGIGVASMHYTGMAAMQMQARMSYNPGLFALSVLIAVVAATVALWFTLRLRATWSTVGAALIMGLAVSGMHYTGMAAMRVYSAAPGAGMAMNGASAEGFLLPLIVGISVLAFVLTATLALSPTDEEIRADTELMTRIGEAAALRPGAHAAAPPAPASSPRWRPVITSRAAQARRQGGDVPQP